MKKAITVLAVAAATLALSAPALAADDFTLVGGAVAETGQVKLVSDLSDTSTTNDSSAISLALPSGLTFANLTALATEYNVSNDSCGGGSPRFEIQIGDKNVFVYLGPAPNFTGCATGWQSSGNLIGNNDQCRWDTSQIQSGTQCTTYSAARALLGSQTITAIRLVTDAGWFFSDKEQTVLVRNVTLNGKTLITPGKPGGGTTANASKLCKAQRAALGDAAFRALWGTNANGANAHGKCVSTMASGKAQQVQQAVLSATKTCKAQGKRGKALAACVSGKSNVGTAAKPRKK